MADISKITLPNNNQYDIKDNVARGQIENKVDKIAGKSLSTNDYTTTEKNKLANIESEANKTIIDSALSSTSENPLQNKIINTALSEKLGVSGDSKNNIVTFTTDDTTDSEVSRATGWSTVAALASGIAHANLFNRISMMMKNVRWLYKILGDTDISALSTEHTITGAISKLNTDLTTLKYHTAGNNPDFNNLTDPGFWYFGDTSSATHAPSTQHGWLFMLVITSDNSNMIVQIVFGGRTSSGSSHRIWVRYCNSGTWNSTWDEYTNRTELDTLNTVQLYTPTYVQNSYIAENEMTIRIRRVGRLGLLYFNAYITNMPKSTGYITIATFSLGSHTPYVTTSSVVAGQKDRSVIVQLDMTGKVNIYNDNSETIIGRYQQIIPFWTE